MKQRQSIVILRRAPGLHRVVEVVNEEANVVFKDWLEGLHWHTLTLLAQCTADHVGSGHEIAFTIYDDDGDAAEEPFKGVRITATYRDGARVVVSRADYDCIVADVCELVLEYPPDPLPEGWASFVKNARTIIDRAAAGSAGATPAP